MAPWDENPWFEAPVGNAVAVSATGWVVAAAPNVRRVGIAFGAVLSGTQGIVIRPGDLPAGAFSPSGLALTASVGFISFIHREWGAWVAGQWVAAGTAAGITLWAAELILRDWPAGGFDRENVPDSIRRWGSNAGPSVPVEQ